MDDQARREDERALRKERARNVLFVLAFLILVTVVAGFAIAQGATAGDIALLGFIAFSAVIVAFAAAVLWEIVNGSIDLYGIISEPDNTAECKGNPKASLSRFQFLVFTFVVAGLFLMLSIEAGTFVNIPNNVLGLIGLSGGGFIVSKAVGHRKSGGSNTTGGGTTAANPAPSQPGPGQQASTGDNPAQPSPG